MSKTRVVISGARKARENATAFLKSFGTNKEFLTGLGQLTADQIRGRVRNLGRNDDEYAQDDLKKSTIKARERLIRAGNSFNATIVKPPRSNLSMSGQLLDAIQFRVNAAASEVVLLLKAARTQYRGIRKEKLDGETSNIKVKDKLEKEGRRFFFISEKLTALLETKIAQELRRKLSIYNKINR